jgi:hypothetical protein
MQFVCVCLLTTTMEHSSSWEGKSVIIPSGRYMPDNLILLELNIRIKYGYENKKADPRSLESFGM